MNKNNEYLFRILRIGHDTSMRGEGISLNEAIMCTRYNEHRPSFGVEDVLQLLKANREIIEEWILYSEDKRTDGGWYILRDGEIGRVDDKNSRMRFETIEQAAAEYVVREIDFWAELNKCG